MQRDFIGYGNQIPKVSWPHQARIAVNFALCYEEGAECNILDGNTHSEGYLNDIPGAMALENTRHLSVESIFEYGSRSGVWRLMRLFQDYKIPLTVFVTGFALERNLLLANVLKDSSYEIAGHGYRWINYRELDSETEKEHIQKTLAVIKNLTGKIAKGWYTGRKSGYTRELIVEAGIQYDSDSYADDLPYWVKVKDQNHLIVPYALDTNDMKYATVSGWNSGIDFFNYLKQAFDYLYREGESYPKMMTIGLHPRLSGRPGRCEVLRNFIRYIQSFEHVWICRREEIADHWLRYHTPGIEGKA